MKWSLFSAALTISPSYDSNTSERIPGIKSSAETSKTVLGKPTTVFLELLL